MKDLNITTHYDCVAALYRICKLSDRKFEMRVLKFVQQIECDYERLGIATSKLPIEKISEPVLGSNGLIDMAFFEQAQSDLFDDAVAQRNFSLAFRIIKERHDYFVKRFRIQIRKQKMLSQKSRRKPR